MPQLPLASQPHITLPNLLKMNKEDARQDVGQRSTHEYCRHMMPRYPLHPPPTGHIAPIVTGDCLQPEVLSTTGVLGYHDNDPMKVLQSGSRRVAEGAPEMAPHERFFGDDETLLSGRLPDGL
ncbi:hypothetical protein E2C01_033481 [Portunus trituberculatus]|uniref:Uncharacterized protein n=1 Tax=Portunus trituberculatus TaxID=210409 RepID=A0A5B7F469_PORTR|nr:hypothetical protein [Portunus trituberculatus]